MAVITGEPWDVPPRPLPRERAVPATGMLPNLMAEGGGHGRLAISAGPEHPAARGGQGCRWVGSVSFSASSPSFPSLEQALTPSSTFCTKNSASGPQLSLVSKPARTGRESRRSYGSRVCSGRGDLLELPTEGAPRSIQRGCALRAPYPEGSASSRHPECSPSPPPRQTGRRPAPDPF